MQNIRVKGWRRLKTWGRGVYGHDGRADNNDDDDDDSCTGHGDSSLGSCASSDICVCDGVSRGVTPVSAAVEAFFAGGAAAAAVAAPPSPTMTSPGRRR